MYSHRRGKGGKSRGDAWKGRVQAHAVPNTVGVFLGDVKYFIEDVLKMSLPTGVHHLLEIALDPVLEPGTILNGRQQPSKGLDADAEKIFKLLRPCPFVFVARSESGEDHRETLRLFRHLENLTFHAACSIEVFEFAGAEPREAWPYVFQHVIPAYVQHLDPAWFALPDQCVLSDRNPHRPPTSSSFCPVQSIRAVPVWSCSSGTYIFLVRPPDSHGHGIWTTVGGGVKRGRGGDRDLQHASQREWDEEVLAWPSATAWEPGVKALPWVVWKANSCAWENWSNCKPPEARERSDGWTSTVWQFLRASSSFLAETIAQGRSCKVVPHDFEVVRKGDPQEHLVRHHTEGLPYVEIEAGAWFRLDLETGTLHAPFPGADVRGDLGHDLLKSKESPALREKLRSTLSEWEAASPEEGGRILHCPHLACISPEGMRNKLDIYRDNFESLQLSSEESTARLIRCVNTGLEADTYHQFYAEEIQALLERRADPTVTVGLSSQATSVLDAVVQNNNLRTSVKERTEEFLRRALR